MENSELRWSTRIPLVRNTLVIRQLVMAVGGSFLFVFLIFGIGTIFEPGERIQVMVSLGSILLILFVLILGLCFVVMLFLEAAMKGGIDAEFSINEKGIGYKAGKSSKALNRLGLLGSALLHSPVAAGASLINISRESEFIRWRDIRSITTYKGQHSILIRRKKLAFPLGVFCTPENFPTVMDLIRKYAPDTPIKEKRFFQP